MSDTNLDKFRGTLVGALVGDCAGNPYEFTPYVKREDLQKFFDSYEEPYDEPGEKLGVLKYTDDSKMTFGLAQSLVEMKKMDPEDMAKRFVDNYYEEPKRGYGSNVKHVFKALKEMNCTGDVFKPAKLQFEGRGSWGNGGAMRISPVPLFFCDNYDLMLEIAKQTTMLTHTHELGINGALLQAICVYKCYHHNPEEPIDADDFVQDVITKMKAFETVDEEEPSLMKKLSSNLTYAFNKMKDKYECGPATYNNQLNKVKFLLKKGDLNDREVKGNLGNGSDESGLYSVPTALYCFLRAQKPIEGLETDNVFRRTISYCISLGGDTDTIASMAGAMCGAYLGLSCISKGLQQDCEAVEDMMKLADKLYSLKFPSS